MSFSEAKKHTKWKSIISKVTPSIISNFSLDRKGIFRIIAEIKPNATLKDLNNIKIYFLQKHSLRLIRLSTSLETSLPTYWDIGFFIFPSLHFVEINTLTSLPMKNDLFIDEYEEFCRFLIQYENISLKNLLGFSTHQKKKKK